MQYDNLKSHPKTQPRLTKCQLHLGNPMKPHLSMVKDKKSRAVIDGLVNGHSIVCKKSFPPLENPELTIRRRTRVDLNLLNGFNMATNENGDDVPPARGDDIPAPDLRTYNFEWPGIKVNGVTDNALRLYLFPHSLTHHATAWFDRLPRNSITTFEQMAKMFLEKYFPPFMVTKLRNEITNFCQRPDESLFEAWERYKLLIDRCPNHNMLPVTQIDTFYNGLTLRHHDTINVVAGGTFMKRRPEECYDLIENMTAHHNDWDTSVQISESSSSITSSSDSEIVALKAEMAEINKNLMKFLQMNQQVKAVTHSCETCSGPHSYNDCPATIGQTQNVYATGAYNQGGFNQNQNQSNPNQNYQNKNQENNHGNVQGNNQGRNQFFQRASHGQNPPPAYQARAYQALGYQAPTQQALIPQPQVVTTTEFTNYMKANDTILKNMQTNMTSLTNSNFELKNMFGQFMKINTASSSGLGTLLSNTVTNPKEDLKGITTRSGIAYKGPTIPTTSSPPKVVERETEVTKDTVPPTNNGSTKDANDQKKKFFQIFQDLNFNISFPDALILMPKFGPTIKSLLTNKEKLFELARTPFNEHCSAVLLKRLSEKLGDPGKFLIPCDFLGMNECLALADLGASINLMPLSVWNKLFLPELSPTCMTLELADRSISRPVRVVEDVFVKIGTFHFPVDFVVVDFNADPRVPLILGRSFLKTRHAFIDVYEGELTLRVGNKAITFNLDQTSRYSANYDAESINRIDVIDVARQEYSQEILGFSWSGNPTPSTELIVSLSSPTLSPFGDSDFLFEKTNAFLATGDEPILPKIDDSFYDSEGDILLLEEFLNDDPSSPPLSPQELKGDDKLPIIISKDLKDEEKTALIKVLKSHKQALAWQLSDIKGAVLGQRKTKHFQPIHYASKTMTDAQAHYTTTKKRIASCGVCFREILAISCLVQKHSVYGHSALKYLFNKQDAKPRLLRWVLLLQEFDIIICDKKKGAENLVADHFSRLENPHQSVLVKKEINEMFPFETLNMGCRPNKKTNSSKTLSNTFGTTPSCLKSVRIKSSGGVFTARKPLIFLRVATMDLPGDIMARTTPPKRCLTLVSIGPESIMMPMTWSNLVTLVNVREKFHNGMKCLKIPSKFARFLTYGASILWGRSRLHEGTSIYSWPSITCRNRFGTPRAIISDRGTHFYNDKFAKVMLKYGVTHCLATAYHPHTSGQVEVSNRGLKRILETTISENCASWLDKLDAFYRYFVQLSKHHRVYSLQARIRKACHLPIELEHKAYWALKYANFDLLTAGDHRKVQLNQLNELRDQAYENSLIFKEKIKRIHDSKIKDRVFNVGDRVLLFNSRLKIFSGKLKTHWTRPFTITQVFPYGTVELSQIDGPNFKVNGHRLKHYFGGDIPLMVVPDLQTFPKDN
nr:reverse transcriptase domain-containing protein [Tanacetum cinerariifolium]